MIPWSRIRSDIPYPGQVTYRWQGMELFQQMIISFIAFLYAYLRFRIIQVSKYKGARRTGLYTSRLHFTVPERPVFQLGLQLLLLNALNTEGAFLHYTPLTHSHIGIQNKPGEIAVHIKIELLILDISEPVEPPYPVWTVVDAIFCTDTPDIGYLVQTLIAVHGG